MKLTDLTLGLTKITQKIRKYFTSNSSAKGGAASRGLLFTLILVYALWSMVLIWAWAGELEVYVNNKPFSDKTIKWGGMIYAEAEALVKVIKDLKFDEAAGNYIFKGKPLNLRQNLSKNGQNKSYLSLKELSDISGGRYEFNPKSNILDVYTFNSQEVAEKIKREVFTSNIIATEDNLQYLLARIKEFMKVKLNMDLGDYPIEISFIDKDALKNLLHNSDALGVAEFKTEGHTLIGLKVYITKGLTLVKAIHTAAHEIAHAWAALKHCTAKDLTEEEGFSEWVAYKVLIDLGFNEEAVMMLNNPDTTYGGGLRRVLEREKQFGTAWVIKYKLENKNTIFKG
jgi:hypothetical protein